MIFDLRSDLYSHIQMLPLRWFDNRATGDIMTRILEDVTSVERMLIDGIEQGVVAVLQLVVVLGDDVLLQRPAHVRGAGAAADSGGRARFGTRSRRTGVTGCNGAPRRR